MFFATVEQEVLQKATQLLKEAGITNIKVFTIENGAKVK